MRQRVQYLQVITTTDSIEVARKIANHLVEEKLAACVQISGPVESVYTWQGATESSQEYRCSIKTTVVAYKQVESAIQEKHNYDVPQIIAIEIANGSDDYLGWLEENIQP